MTSNYNATAFGLLGASNTYSGGGSSEDNRLRLDGEVLFVLRRSLFTPSDCTSSTAPDGSANTAIQADIG